MGEIPRVWEVSYNGPDTGRLRRGSDLGSKVGGTDTDSPFRK